MDILREYLMVFALASKGAPERIYLDLFAGSFENKRRDREEYFAGSPKIALNVEPAFTHVILFEKRDKANALISSIQDTEPHKTRSWKVVSGDCNVTIDKGLAYLRNRRAPTIAFLDPDGLQVNWTTLEKLAKWKRNSKTKMELFILFNVSALPRVIGAGHIKKLKNFYGTEEWVSIYRVYHKCSLDANILREKLVDLYRWQLEEKLEYKTTHVIGIGDNNIPKYALIFATDHSVGDRVMNYIYKTYSERIIPMMQAEANIARKTNKDQYTLEGMSFTELEPPRSTIRYEHLDPRPPPQVEGEVCFDWITEMSPSLPFAWSED